MYLYVRFIVILFNDVSPVLLEHENIVSFPMEKAIKYF